MIQILGGKMQFSQNFQWKNDNIFKKVKTYGHKLKKKLLTG